MTNLIDVRERLHATNAMLNRLEQSLAEHPQEEASLLTNIHSLVKRQQTLEAQFLELADQRQIDICSYRLLSSGEENRPNAWTLTKTLADFQRWFSVVYDAVKSGVPKPTAHISGQALEATTLRFGYSYPGSVGIVFTLPAERLLIGETYLDETISVVGRMARTIDPQAIKYLAGTYGPAPIKALYDWADGHARAGLGANIEWRRGQQVTSALLVQQPDFEAVRSAIAQTGESHDEMIVLIGELRAADTIQKSFRLLRENDTIIRGTFEDAISQEHTVELPKRYKFTLVQTTTVRYSTEEDRITYFLQSLERLS